MSDIVRAWKDETYRENLSVEEQGALAANPAGEIDLTDVELDAVYGAWGTHGYTVEDNRQNDFSAGVIAEDYSCDPTEPVFAASGSTLSLGSLLGSVLNLL